MLNNVLLLPFVTADLFVSPLQTVSSIFVGRVPAAPVLSLLFHLKMSQEQDTVLSYRWIFLFILKEDWKIESNPFQVSSEM